MAGEGGRELIRRGEAAGAGVGEAAVDAGAFGGGGDVLRGGEGGFDLGGVGGAFGLGLGGPGGGAEEGFSQRGEWHSAFLAGMRGAVRADWGQAASGGEVGALSAFGCEVVRVEPGLEAGADGGPFGVGDGEPGGVAAFALDDHVVAEGAFVGEAEAGGGAAGGGVGGVAAPLPAAIGQGGHHVVGKEEEGLGGDAGAGDPGAPEDVADLGGAVGGGDVHEGLAAFDAVGGAVDDGEEHRVGTGGFGDEPGIEVGAGGGDGVGEVAVEAFSLGAGDGFVELVAVKGGVEGFEAAPRAFEGLALGGWVGGGERHWDFVWQIEE